MTVTYRFENLCSLADHFSAQAVELRGQLAQGKPTSKKYAVQRERATTLESVADMLRNTALGAK